MSEFNIEVDGGSSVRLPTAGKYCDRDIVVTARGGGDELFVSTYYPVVYERNTRIEVGANKYWEGPANYTACAKLETFYLEGFRNKNTQFVPRFEYCAELKEVIVPHCHSMSIFPLQANSFTNCNKLEKVQLGSIGYPVADFGGDYRVFKNCTAAAMVEIYVAATSLADIPNLVNSQPWGATNATIVYRNSTTGEVITE